MSQTTPATLPASETTNDLCRVLHVTPQTIRQMQLKGQVPPSIRIGRRNLWPAGTAARLLAGAQEGGAQ